MPVMTAAVLKTEIVSQLGAAGDLVFEMNPARSKHSLQALNCICTCLLKVFHSFLLLARFSLHCCLHQTVATIPFQWLALTSKSLMHTALDYGFTATQEPTAFWLSGAFWELLLFPTLLVPKEAGKCCKFRDSCQLSVSRMSDKNFVAMISK